MPFLLIRQAEVIDQVSTTFTINTIPYRCSIEDICTVSTVYNSHDTFKKVDYKQKEATNIAPSSRGYCY